MAVAAAEVVGGASSQLADYSGLGLLALTGGMEATLRQRAVVEVAAAELCLWSMSQTQALRAAAPTRLAS